MADASLLNIQAFQPFDGGRGKRIAATTSSGTTAHQVPGLSGGTDGNNNKRVLIINGGMYSAFVHMGPSTVQASTDSLEVMPGIAYLLTPPDVNPSGVWIAACTESDATKISIIAGQGT